ncbi:Lrp/AsnC family transcriptional regulator [Noviherbaspirillum sp. UKPF54]|uniref:Lrp/AsnC family transcriptional regulator n=1 Tax=Noviherbaspirillum sp. UKPF54 TaxID=2601898 RepID=UPI001AEFFE75|nr:Lrp/AsnC family transcriptional regulator [Noviherbaspirillum sp. UKPF54]
MPPVLDSLDRQLIDLLKVNARLPVVKLAKALGCARSTVQLRLKALEDAGVVSGYTISVATVRSAPGINAMVMISSESKDERSVVRALSRLHNINKLYTISGRYDLCAMLTAESTDELDATIDRIREIKGVIDTFSTVLLSKKLDRPE